MTGPVDRAHWARVARDWIAWARTPGHDEFWAYRAAFVAFIGRGEGEALDIGCGEGRVSRELKACGYRVVATDPVFEMVGAAQEARSANGYAVAPGSELPFGDARFDLAVAYNVLMDVDDLCATVKEIRRVLRPSGTLIISVVHPISDRGQFASATPVAPFVVEGSYFEVRRFDATAERDGLPMHWAGWSLPLEAYAVALEAAGFAITALREPVPAPGHRGDHLQRWSRIPLFLWLKARPFPPE